MKKFDINHILVPTDFSETALLAMDHAVHLARKNKAKITLLNVYEPLLTTNAYDPNMLSFRLEMESKIQDAALDRLDHIANEIKSASGIDVMIRFELGRAYMCIVETARMTVADIIVMGTHGVSGEDYAFIGSNAYRVAQESPCPVMSIRKSTSKIGFENIVLPIDNTMQSRLKVPYAAEMAILYGATIHIAGLYTSTEERDINIMNLKVAQVEAYLKGREINTTVTRLDGHDLAQITQNFANSVKADLIVIMTEQEEHHVSGLLFGPHAQHIIHKSNIPVMTIRPADINEELVQARF